jgi:hypothetical protein
MAERLMIVCDNPDCKSVGTPEFIPGQDGPKRKGQRIMGPYGWHQGDGFLIGCGPSYRYMACSDACVGPAVTALVRAARDEENERYR